MSVSKRRNDALHHLWKTTTKRRKLLARFIDHAIMSNKRPDGTFYGMTMLETKEVFETLMDVKRICETQES